MRERRRRVWRRLGAFLLVSLLLVVLIVINRDQAEVRTCRRRMLAAAQALREMHDDVERERLTVLFAERDAADDWRGPLRGHVQLNMLYDYHRGEGRREIGVMCCFGPHRRLFGAPGRHIIVYDSATQDYEVRWYTESEFDRIAPTLGLTPSPR